MAATSGVDRQFVMLRTAMREKIFEYIGKKQMSAEWSKRLPYLAERLEEILYIKFPNMNDYSNMMKGPIEPQLQYAIKTLSAQNQQNQQNPQMARETASSSGTMTPVGNHDALCEQSASLLADKQNNNADEHDKTDTGFLQHQQMEDMAALSGVDQQFEMLRSAVRKKIFEYIGRKQSSAEWHKRLPELANRLEEILYKKFPNRNDYSNMMKGPIEPQLQYAIKTLSAQNQQNQQNPQMARETASSSGTMTPVGNHDALCEQSASLLADKQYNNADEHDKTDTGFLQHQQMEDMAALSGVDQQFEMLRSAVRKKIFEYIGRKQSSAEWHKRLPELANRLEEILYKKFPNRNDYSNMMKGPIEPQLQYAIKTLSTQNQQNQQNPQMARETASSSGTMTPDVNHGDLFEQSASVPADVQNNNADELDRTE